MMAANLSDPCPTCGERHDLDLPMPPSGTTAEDIARDVAEGFAFYTSGGGLHLTDKGRARLNGSRP